MNIHLIGICGTAMATLAAMLKRKGLNVRGSDQDIYPPMSDFLAGEAIPVLTGYSADHITGDLDLVVVGNAISRGNPELEEVLDRKIRYCSLPEAIREHFLWGARSVVIAGTHGKTTTTSVTGWLLTHGGADPSVLVGGIARNFGEHGSSYRIGSGRDFVIEGDEYDSAFFDKTAKFLKYLPDIAVINNVEFDHADIYADFDAVTLAFRRLVNLVPRRGLLLVGADSEGARALIPSATSRVQTFGTSENVEWQAHDIETTAEGTRFKVRRGGSPFGVFETMLVGAHTFAVGLAAMAVAASLRCRLPRWDGLRRGWVSVLRRGVFFAAKTTLVLLAVLLCGLEFTPAASLSMLGGTDMTAEPLSTWLFLMGSMGALCWSILDQRRRCRVCLRRLGLAAHVGCPGCLLLDWAGTELVCVEGHGMLHISDMAVCWRDTERWTWLDESWQGLFTTGRGV